MSYALLAVSSMSIFQVDICVTQTFLSLTNRKVVRESLSWVIPRSLFIRNCFLTDLETYELRSFDDEQKDRQGEYAESYASVAAS